MKINKLCGSNGYVYIMTVFMQGQHTCKCDRTASTPSVQNMTFRDNFFLYSEFYDNLLIMTGCAIVHAVITRFPPRQPGFESRSSHEGSVLDKVAVSMFSPEYYGFACQF
jgi:hypothetical protein